MSDVMGAWLACLVLFLAVPNVWEAPALGPWCDYSHVHFETRTDPAGLGGHSTETYDHVPTRWAPPLAFCSASFSDEHGNDFRIQAGYVRRYPLLGDRVTTWLLELLVVVLPLFGRWFAADAPDPIPARRRWASLLAAGGYVVAGVGLLGFLSGARPIAVAYLVIGGTVAWFGRRSERALAVLPPPFDANRTDVVER